MGKPVWEDENCNNLNFLALILIYFYSLSVWFCVASLYVPSVMFCPGLSRGRNVVSGEQEGLLWVA